MIRSLYFLALCRPGIGGWWEQRDQSSWFWSCTPTTGSAIEISCAMLPWLHLLILFPVLLSIPPSHTSTPNSLCWQMRAFRLLSHFLVARIVCYLQFFLGWQLYYFRSSDWLAVLGPIMAKVWYVVEWGGHPWAVPETGDGNKTP